MTRLTLPFAMTVVVFVSAGCSSSTASTTPRALATSANGFLRDYVDPDGRVVRHDQGGDTVSEGQAYAMLLDVATGDRVQFAAVWSWSQAHLGQADGLLASRWQNGSVVDPNAASDADVDVARALVLAGLAWSQPALLRDGRSYAASILRSETVTVANRLWLVAGPWARVAPRYVNPSYFDPAGFELLASVTGDVRWTAILEASDAVIVADTANGTRLPSDWAVVDPGGQVQPSGAPAGGPVIYGYDAFRTLVRQSDDCRHGAGWRADRTLRALAEQTASPATRANTYNTDGTPAEPGASPFVGIAAAGASYAAGDQRAAHAYLDAASAVAARTSSYFLRAWAALAPYFITTSTLTRCPT